MYRALCLFVLFFSTFGLRAELIPGFRLEQIGTPEGFLTSLAFDAENRLHYTTFDGGIWRLESDGSSVEVARVDTAMEGNAAMLGMAFAPDGTVVVHYVQNDLSADLISRIDLDSGEETLLARLACSPGNHPCPTEHHGGNPDVAPDGTIFFGIGDYGLNHIAQRDDVYAAKIYRLSTDGALEVYAKGLRNPFDLAWDAGHERIVGADNGASSSDDEIIFVEDGQNHGWPLTMGTMPPVDGMTPPVYVFPDRVAPTGLFLAASQSGWFREGLVVSSFVTKALYFFPELSESQITDPVTIFAGETTEIIDTRQNLTGEIFVGTSLAIYRLVGPAPGDADGNGVVDVADREALLLELGEHEGMPTVTVHQGLHPSTWGADADQNGVVDRRDLVELNRMLSRRNRPVRHPDPGSSLRQQPIRHPE